MDRAIDLALERDVQLFDPRADHARRSCGSIRATSGPM
jgi:hypothetical protein